MGNHQWSIKYVIEQGLDLHSVPFQLNIMEILDSVRGCQRNQLNNPFVLSISWGDFEESSRWSVGTLDHVNDSLQEAALMGVTICVASGDDGSDDGAGNGHAHADFPAPNPFALADGGPALIRDRAARDASISTANRSRLVSQHHPVHARLHRQTLRLS